MRVRLALHTAFYILSVSLVMASAINPVWTARMLRRQASRVAAVVRTVPGGAAIVPAKRESASAADATGLIGSAPKPRRADR
jgi:hypothetical protein